MYIHLNQFRTFYLAATLGSLRKTAEKLCVTQPAVSMQIKAFENDLGLKLFRNRGNRLELTKAGHMFLGYGKRIFSLVEEMEQTLARYEDLDEGSLTIGTTRSFARHLMPGLLAAFQEKYPKIKVSLVESNSQQIAEGLLEYKYDLGIIGRIPVPKALKQHPNSLEDFCLALPPGHRFSGRSHVSFSELENEPIILREAGSGSGHALRRLLEVHHAHPSVLIEAGSVEFIKEYVIKGRGVSFLYKPEVELEVKLGLLTVAEIEEGPIRIQTDVVFRRDLEMSPLVQAFLGIIEENKKAG